MKQEFFEKEYLEIGNDLDSDGVLDKKVLRRYTEPDNLILIGDTKLPRDLYGGCEPPAGILEFQHCARGKNEVLPYINSTVIRTPKLFLKRITVNYHPSPIALDGKIIADADAFIIDTVDPEMVARICNELKRDKNLHQMPRHVWFVSSSGPGAGTEIHKKITTQLGCRFEVHSDVCNIRTLKLDIISRLSARKLELLKRDIWSCLNHQMQRIPRDIRLKHLNNILEKVDGFLSDLIEKIGSIFKRLTADRDLTEKEVKENLKSLIAATRENLHAIVKKPFLRNRKRSARWNTTCDNFNEAVTTILETRYNEFETRGITMVKEELKDIEKEYKTLIKDISRIADFSLQHDFEEYTSEPISTKGSPSRMGFRTAAIINIIANTVGKAVFGYLADISRHSATDTVVTTMLSNSLNIGTQTMVASASGGTVLGGIGGFSTTTLGMGSGSSIMATVMATAGASTSTGAQAGSLPAPGVGTAIGAGAGFLIGVGMGVYKFHGHVKDTMSKIDKAFESARDDAVKDWSKSSTNFTEHLKEEVYTATSKGCTSPRTQLLKIIEVVKAELREIGFSPSPANLTVDELTQRLLKYRKYADDLTTTQ